MSGVLESVKKKVLDRQNYRCVGRPRHKDGEVCGMDLAALLRTGRAWRRRYLPPGRQAPVEFDHRTARVDGGGDDPDNIDALCAWCHQEKTDAERPGWDAPTPSVFAERVAARAPLANKPKSKAMRLRAKAPNLQQRRCG